MSSALTKGRLVLRILLLLILAAALATFYGDRRARAQVQNKNDQLTEMDASGVRDGAAVYRILNRKPSSVVETDGGIIEYYKYRAGLPGRFYTIRVGYLRGEEGTLTYVAHDLNASAGDPGLALAINAQKSRLTGPATGQPESFGEHATARDRANGRLGRGEVEE